MDSAAQQDRSYGHSSGAPGRIRILTSEEQIELRTDYEREAFNLPKNRTYVYTKVFDPDLLTHSSMGEEFQAVFQAIGWGNF